MRARLLRRSSETAPSFQMTRVATALGLVMALGCDAPGELSLEVTFADAATRDATVAVELTVRAGECESGERLWQRVVRSGEQPTDTPPPLPRGRAYCIEATARDAACAITGRATHASGDAPTGLVTLELVRPDDAPAGCEQSTCVEGVCVERCDEDGAACVAEGVAGVCRAGACCTGCWDGERCMRGTPAAELSAGEYFTCMRAVDGRVACWGSNGQGELGDGTRGGSSGPSWRADPRTIDAPEGTRFSAVTTGVASAYAIDTEGRLWAWGWNERGQLGLGTAAVGVNALSPVEVPHPLGNAWERVEAVRTHADTRGPDLHVCAFSRGELWCWGANGQGQVDPTQPAGSRDAIVASPRRVEGLWGDVAVSQRTTCAVRAEGAGVSCWGDNARGELGTGDDEPRSGVVPVTLPSEALPVVEIAAGSAGFCVRGGAGGDRVFCWGDDDTNLPTPPGTPVRGVDEATALGPIAGSTESRRLALGLSHGGALTDGAPIVWGSNSSGRLALGTAAGAGPFPPGPALAVPGAAATVREIDVGALHTCVRLDDGSLACAGSNQFGQLGVPVAQPTHAEWQRHCPCVDCGS